MSSFACGFLCGVAVPTVLLIVAMYFASREIGREIPPLDNDDMEDGRT